MNNVKDSDFQNLFGILNLVQDPVLCMDSSGLITFVNPSASQWLDSSPQRLLNKKKLQSVVTFDPPIFQTGSMGLDPEGKIFHECSFTTHSGTSGVMSVSTQKIWSEAGFQTLLILRDMSAEVNLHKKYKKTVEDLNRTLENNIQQQIQLQLTNTELDSKIFDMSCLLDYTKQTQLTSDKKSLLSEFMEFVLDRFQFNGGLLIARNSLLNQNEIQWVKNPTGQRRPLEKAGQLDSYLSIINLSELPLGTALHSRVGNSFEGLTSFLLDAIQNEIVISRMKTSEGELLALFSLAPEQRPPAARELSLISNLSKQTEVMIENTELKFMAITDEMTKLYNQRYFQISIHRELQRGLEKSTPLSLLLLDVDHFKKVNDTYGHPIGDLVLKGVAGQIGQLSRSTDQAFRYGGEEFAILLPDTTLENAALVAERVRKRIENLTIQSGNMDLKATVSVGVACLSVDLKKSEDIIKAADLALYSAKHSGRNQVQIYDEKMTNRPSLRSA
jgi:diguanylate cyclase (GGDEF)-like protein